MGENVVSKREEEGEWKRDLAETKRREVEKRKVSEKSRKREREKERTVGRGKIERVKY